MRKLQGGTCPSAPQLATPMPKLHFKVSTTDTVSLRQLSFLWLQRAALQTRGCKSLRWQRFFTETLCCREGYHAWGYFVLDYVGLLTSNRPQLKILAASGLYVCFYVRTIRNSSALSSHHAWPVQAAVVIRSRAWEVLPRTQIKSADYIRSAAQISPQANPLFLVPRLSHENLRETASTT